MTKPPSDDLRTAEQWATWIWNKNKYVGDKDIFMADITHGVQLAQDQARREALEEAIRAANSVRTPGFYDDYAKSRIYDYPHITPEEAMLDAIRALMTKELE